MTENSTSPSKRLFEPMDRISEVLFGLIMVLTFTGSFSVASSGTQEVRAKSVSPPGIGLCR